MPGSDFEKLDNVICDAYDAYSNADLTTLAQLGESSDLDTSSAAVLIESQSDCSAYSSLVDRCLAVAPADPTTSCAPEMGRYILAGRVLLSDLSSLIAFSSLLKIHNSPFAEEELNVSTGNTAVLGQPNSPIFLGANAQVLHPIGIEGQGVVVGIIDTGIDLAHQDFRDAANNTRVRFLWDQADNTGMPPALVAPFNYGSQYTAAQINGGGVPHVDKSGHGTHVAGIAAGDGSGSAVGPPFPFEGMAPKSPIVFVKNRSMASVLDALSYIHAKAAGLGMPSVTNMSFGHQEGPHDGTSLIESGIAGLLGAGRLAVKSAGNDGDEAQHAEGVGGQTLQFTVGAGRMANIFVQVWHDPNDSYDVTVTTPAPAFTTPVVNPNGSRADAGGYGRITITNRTAAYRLRLAHGIDIRVTRGAQAVIRPGVWTVTLTRVANAGNGKWDAWTNGNATFINFTGGTASITHRRKITEPGNACNIITVAAHTTKSPFPAAPNPESLGQLAEFSSPGPTRDDRQKPELSAPGHQIASTFAVAVPPTGLPNADATHTFKSGTSMAAPHVTGCLALIAQQTLPATLTPATALAQLKALIRTDAESVQLRQDTDNDGRFKVATDCPGPVGTPCRAIAGHWNADFGWGKLNCAIKAKDVVGAEGTFFSVDRGTVGIAGDVVTNNHPSHLYVGDNDTNGLGIDKETLGLGAFDNPGMGILDNLDAFTFLIDPSTLVPPPRFSGIEFSVDGLSVGLAGTAVNAHPAHRQGHVWQTPWPFPPAGVPAGINLDLFEELELGLSFGDNLDALDLENPILPTRTVANQQTVFPANAAFPLVPRSCSGPGCCADTVVTNRPTGGGPVPDLRKECDGDVTRQCATDADCDGIGLDLLFSLDPASPSLAAINGRPADILHSNGNGALPSIAVPAAGLGLVPGAAGCAPPACDDVDAYFVDHLGNQVFSLRRGSPTLGAGGSPADLLQPGLPPVLHYAAAALGLDAMQDDVDAVDVEVCRYTAAEKFFVKDGVTIEPGVYLEVADVGGSMKIGRNVFAGDGSVLASDSLKIGTNSSIANVDTANLTLGAGSIIRGVLQGAPLLPLPFDTSPRMAPTCTGTNVTVPANGFQVLASGLYGDVKVSTGAQLVLGQGPYRFCSLKVDKNASVTFTGADQSSLAVLKLKVNLNSTLGPSLGTPVPRLEVGGHSTVVLKGLVTAHLAAPFASVKIGRATTFRGSLTGKRIKVLPTSTLGC